jgi:hypothetical protein
MGGFSAPEVRRRSIRSKTRAPADDLLGNDLRFRNNALGSMQSLVRDLRKP